ncbi:MAG: SMP-30/gluconolactonase/LRE family protein, partial [Gammaproteobacteria bacterium]|nr:SMP-30/gluconolactonase/LRE family protein [Gammaproteobacteria bacterium]
MAINVLDRRFLELVDESQELATIDSTFNFTEGPIWHPHEHHITFSDIPESKLYRWSESAGLSVYREPTNMANGNTYDKSGRILSCEHASSQVRRDDNGEMQVVASHFEGKELNSPNDIIVRSDGMILFTDPTYGRKGMHGVDRETELDFQGVYQLHPETLELTLLGKDFLTPNGLCFGLDESTLFVADTQQRHVRRFQIEGNTLTGGEIFAESPAPDGLKIDSLGHLYAGGPGGVHVYHRDDGAPLGIIETPGFCANFTWGGADLLTMF